MPTTPQQKDIVNRKIRPLADRLGQLYNLTKALQAEAQAEGWVGLFPSSAEVIEDGSDNDGRMPITFADVASFITDITTFISDMEASSNARRNRALKIAVNPERL